MNNKIAKEEWIVGKIKPYLLIINLHVNEFNFLMKTCRVARWKKPNYSTLKNTNFSIKGTYELEEKWYKEVFHANGTKL